jgi:hypothetical protein
MPQLLHPSAPNLAANDPANTKLPGVCIHIIGMLKLITFCNFHVVHSCGKYCTHASSVAHMPRNVAQLCRLSGDHSRNASDKIKTMKKWKTQVSTTIRAVRQVGRAGASDGCGSGPGLGKKMRKRNILWASVNYFTQLDIIYISDLVSGINLHHCKAGPLYKDLGYSEQSSYASEASVYKTAANVGLSYRQ